MTADRAGRPPTMAQVAARAGVSRSLVSTVFRGVPGASAETRSRVLQAARELGYRVDRRARLLRASRTNLVGIVVEPTATFHAAVAVALHDRIAQSGRSPSIGLVTPAQSLIEAAETQLGMGAEAIVVVGPATWAPRMEADLARLDQETVLVAVDDPVAEPAFDAIRVDDCTAMSLAIDHLAELGHARIGYVDAASQVSGPPRRLAYETASARRGLAPIVIPGGGTRTDGARVAPRVVDAMLDAGVTAIATYNDDTALGIMDVISGGGPSVPAALSIVGFDDLPESAMPHRLLTSIHQDDAATADAVMDRLDRRLDGAPRVGRVLTEPALTVRASTAAPGSR